MFLNNENNITESTFDLEILKEAAFRAKIQTKLPSGKKDINYDLILLPIIEPSLRLTQDEILLNDKLNSKLLLNNYNRDSVLASLMPLFKGIKIDLDKVNLSINIIALIGGNHSITYTDGSFKKDTSQASYGVVKILNEDEKGLYDDFTDKYYNYQQFSGIVESGTNNIGELTGIKIAVENFDDNQYQIIISDSEYGIKSYREWFYTWKDNGFKNYAKKPISNKDLILETYDAIQNSGKIIFFKWVKGHSKQSFNEMCDELAKNALNIKK
jgi:ribonuclease HI